MPKEVKHGMAGQGQPGEIKKKAKWKHMVRQILADKMEQTQRRLGASAVVIFLLLVP